MYGKIITTLCLILGFSWVGHNLYNYAFDTSAPAISIQGIQNNGYYAGDVQCTLHSQDSYKIAHISILLDGKPLVNKYKINRKSCEYPFTLGSKTIPNGKHALKIIVEDASYNHNTSSEELVFTVDNNPLQAGFVKQDKELKVFQGRTLHIQFQVNKEIKEAFVHTLSQSFKCYRESANSLVYDCYIPIKSDEIPNEYMFSIEITDHVGTTITIDNKFQIVAFPFKKQNLHLNNEKIKTENETGLPVSQLEQDLAQATLNSPDYKLWQGSFYAPCDMRGVSTEFGTVRITPQRGKYSHDAIDLMGTPRSVVWATQDGTVVIKERYAHSGNTVVIDHGCGILSLFFHLDSFAAISIGDKIKKGNPIGTLGMTGYASGYHLHWEMRINNIAVDPMQWTKHDF